MINKLWVFLASHKKRLILLAFLFALAFPWMFASKYLVRIGTVCLMYTMLALSLNLMVGFLGQMSFGHAAFWGIGAYTAAILVTRIPGCPAIVSFTAAAVMAGAFGLLLGLPVLKLKGYYFTIITMVFCEIIRLIELNWMSLTRGSLGIMAIAKPSFFGMKITTPHQFYYLILALLVLTVVVINHIMTSSIGQAVLAIRDDELAAAAMGINVFKYKMMIFIVSSMLAGLAGAFYAQYTGYIDPSGFSGVQSNEMLVMVIFGGLGNVLGSFIGAIGLSILPEMLRGLMQYRMFIYGALLVGLMLVRPDGLLGNVNFKYIGQRAENGGQTGTAGQSGQGEKKQKSGQDANGGGQDE